MQMKIKPLHPDFKPPVYGSPGAAAFDIRTPVDFTLTVDSPEVIKLGFAAEVPEGYVAVIAPRSGLGCKNGMGLRNTIGIIDSDYRGEIQATLTLDMFGGLNSLKYFKAGDRILQCMILPVSQVDFEIVDELSDTERGKGGFGSTGVE